MLYKFHGFLRSHVPQLGMQGQHIIAFDGTTMAFAFDEDRALGPSEAPNPATISNSYSPARTVVGRRRGLR